MNSNNIQNNFLAFKKEFNTNFRQEFASFKEEVNNMLVENSKLQDQTKSISKVQTCIDELETWNTEAKVVDDT